MNVQDYIKVYEETVDDELCNSLMSAKLDYKPSLFSDHKGITKNSEERVVMDDAWIHKDNKFYEPLKVCLLYTSPSPRDRQKSRMPSSA